MPPDEILAEVVRTEWGAVIARLVARTRRLDLVEDALGEATVRAAARWPRDGVPDNPGAWLYTTAHRLVVGRIRAEAMAGRKAPLLAVRDDWREERIGDEWPDDRLPLILLCCHPALPPASRPALALRLVIGTPTEEIARLFLVSPSTMAARLTRAKKKIVAAGIPLAAPPGEELAARLDEVCRTVYLAFTAGYAPGRGSDLVRADVAADAVALATVLHGLVPDRPQVRGLLALLRLQHARRDARVSGGRLVTLAEQDRHRWHRREIDAGLALIDADEPAAAYAAELHLQARIAAQHAVASSSDDTDWAAIAELYRRLEQRTGSPVVRLNRAVAVAEVDGPAAAWALVEGLEQILPTSHRLAAVQGDLARRRGDRSVARASLRRAVALCDNDVEREHLQRRLDELDGGSPASSPDPPGIGT